MAATAKQTFVVVIKNHYDPIYSLRLTIDSEEMTVGSLKGLIEEQHKGSPSVSIQMLVFHGKLLDSQSRLSTIRQSAHSMDSAMCIHMTLRGGNTTAKLIGLSSETTSPQSLNPAPPQPLHHSPLSPEVPPVQSTESALDIGTTSLMDNHDDQCKPSEPEVVPEFDGADNLGQDDNVQSAASPNASAQQPPPPLLPRTLHPATSLDGRGRPPRSGLPPLAPPPGVYPMTMHRQYSDPGRMLYPPSPFTPHSVGSPHGGHYGHRSPYSGTVPNPYLMHSPFHPQLSGQRPHSTYPPQFGLPMLVQQSSSGSASPMPSLAPSPMHYGYPGYPVPPPMSPYGAPISPYPVDPRMAHRSAFGHFPAPFNPHLGAPPQFPPRSESFSPQRPSMARYPNRAEQLKRSQSEDTKTQKEEDKAEDTEQVHVAADRQRNGDVAAFGGYGMRRRRVPLPNGPNNGNAPGIGNEARNLNNALNADHAMDQGVANEVDGNQNDDEQDVAADAENPGFMIWLIGALNINILLRMGMFMWFIGSNLSTNRYYAVCVGVAIYYFHQIGLLKYLFGDIRWADLWGGGGGNVAANNEPRHRDPNAPEIEEEPAPPQPLTYVELIQRGLIGFTLSLWPTWDHRQMYPAQQVRR